MQITEEQKNHVLMKLNQFWQGKKACPICNTEKWNVSNKLFEVRELSVRREENTDICPVVPITCDMCGNMILFNAIHLGFTFSLEFDEDESQ